MSSVLHEIGRGFREPTLCYRQWWRRVNMENDLLQRRQLLLLLSGSHLHLWHQAVVVAVCGATTGNVRLSLGAHW